MNKAEEPFLTVAETARLLGVHENTVRNWVTGGTLVSARLPGAKQHRFAREEVMRLVAQRGNPASSIAPQLRRVEPELVSAMELDQWAASSDAKGTFPDLIRRLLALTPGISNVDIRAQEGVAAPGWDGSATSAGNAFLPAGELRFEFGTEKNSKGKAQSDYDNRVLGLPADKDAVLIVATPRNWARGRGWAADRTKEKKFKGVKAIDAHVLEGWLRATPSVHYWISERLGRHPRDAQTISKWWEAFQGRVRYKIPANFFAAGRTKEVGELITLLKSGSPTDPVATVKAPWRDESLAFIYAALDADPALLNRTIVVTDASAWNRLVASPQKMILVPLFEDRVDLKAAEDGGHRVILVAGSDDIVRNGEAIELPKIDRGVAAASLKGIDFDSGTPDGMVALARRSMPAFLRSIAREPRLATPEWVKDSRTASILAPLVLAGSWTGHPGDAAILEKLTGASASEVERLLKTLAKRSDAPFVMSGGMWRLTSPAEAAYLLLREMELSDLERWRDVVLEVLLAEDPFSGMDTVARLTASAAGTAPAYSGTLQKQFAEGLVLAAATAGELPSRFQMQAHVDEIVGRLLESASEDPAGEVWLRLAPFLPSLAEAAPEIFQDAVDVDLARPEPILKTLFRDKDGDSDFFGPSSPHLNLLWALETLCWSPDHFGRAAGLLARVAAIDPGGHLSNRPLESLQKVTAGWVAHSGGNVEDKVAVIERALQVVPSVGWFLVLNVWPSGNAGAFAPRGPIFRDWAPKKQSVSYADWDRFVSELVRLAVDAVGDRADRWIELIPKIDNVPSHERTRIINAFRRVSSTVSWSEKDRHDLWDAFTREIARHEEFPDSYWAMSADDLQPFKDVATEIAPTNDPRRYSRLFGWRVPVSGLKRGDDGYDVKLAELQREAIGEVLSQGLDQLEALIADVPIPTVVGRHLATMTGAPEEDILAWVATDVSRLRDAALAYARWKISEEGMNWLRSALDSTHLASGGARESLMAAVPFAKAFWTEVDALDESLSAGYWQRVVHYEVPEADRAEAVDLLLEHDRPWQAVGLLSEMLDSKQAPDVELVKRALRAVIGATGPADDRQMSSYFIGMLLDYMEREAPDDSDLPSFEFMFFELVHDHEPSGALYRALRSDPGDFVELVKAVFRGDGEAKRKLTAQDQAYGHLAWSVLREWPALPGLRDDGTIDGDHLTEWVRGARLALADVGRAAIGDEQVGQVLASSPHGADGVWPAEEVRDIIENLVNTRIETGLHIGRTNQRGVTSRGMFDGGDQERTLEQEYRDMAARISTKWPRTARVLRGIADNYQREASRNDAEAERLGDDG
ncbi:helix-turn-helix domain-containing protein [Promicromonospora sp. NPDC057138]|uniref:helix-turn-helix domain-containing protein n=1 Tax=Promicromonospora sp. NPDC057138 TaxID=3346031 RepID=UPI003641B2E0